MPVFSFRGLPISRMLNIGWIRARRQTGLTQVRVHDLKHTFGQRLRAAGVNFEDRQYLLGHRSGRITTHYSALELHRLLEAANSIVSSHENNVSGCVREASTVYASSIDCLSEPSWCLEFVAIGLWIDSIGASYCRKIVDALADAYAVLIIETWKLQPQSQ